MIRFIEFCHVPLLQVIPHLIEFYYIVQYREEEMKKIEAMTFALTFILTSTATLSLAEPWKEWKGSGGWSRRSAYQKMYDLQTVSTMNGEVVEVEKITPLRGMSYGIHLKLRTADGILSVHLGPSWFVERQDLKIAKGDKIEVKGSRITFNDEPAVIAAEIKKGNDTLVLRDENGFPLWSGMRHR